MLTGSRHFGRDRQYGPGEEMCSRVNICLAGDDIYPGQDMLGGGRDVESKREMIVQEMLTG